MSKQTRFARAFEPWIAEWAEAGLSGTQERVMLLLAANMERNSKGQFESWRPRAEMAEILGVSEPTIRDAVKKLVKKGMLKKIGGAYNGRSQRYVLMPKKGGSSAPPIIERGGYGTPKGGAMTLPKGGSSAPPTRTLEGACAAPSSEGRPSAGEIDYGASSAEIARRIV